MWKNFVTAHEINVTFLLYQNNKQNKSFASLPYIQYIQGRMSTYCVICVCF